MDETARESGAVLVDRLLQMPASSRLLVGIYGIPASGKTTFANLLFKHTDTLLQNSPSKSILVSLDGWHLTRAQLDQFPDPKLARDRRGIHWTFDGPGYLQFVQTLRQEITSSSHVITAPSFDHAVKDPEPDAVQIHPHHRLILIEGLYTALDVDSWREAALLLDERWCVEIPTDEAQKRLIKRHLLSGVAGDPAEALWRAEENDMPNGRFLLANSLKPTRIITSVEDPVLPSSE
ncbi:hypothetical protein D9757_001417 [Collybiopsis confluens]|uniref:P-loop containing nucleoside triphosphate hydrolase protein n=1 Tax=Collybiopsis confluens TaxID=2823264 RepID=A0A8H5MFU8_9AGAR|nr:hypothetical protein D9757_001417 [Collybiopsis confluens]